MVYSKALPIASVNDVFFFNLSFSAAQKTEKSWTDLTVTAAFMNLLTHKVFICVFELYILYIVIFAYISFFNWTENK